MTIKILLADDHVMIRQGLRSLLMQQREWQVVAEAGDGMEAIRLAQQHRPEVAILDVAMPEVSGVEATQQIRKLLPKTRIVALSMYGDAHYLDLMLQAGACAYVLKDEAVVELVDAIRAALRGSRFISPALVKSGTVPSTRSTRLEKRSLTDREIEVLRLITEGLKSREIAAELGIGVKTVETYRSRIMTKLGIDHVPGLVKFAIKAGIISPY